MRKDSGSKVARWGLAGVQAILGFLEGILRQISDSTYTHIVLTSNNYLTAGQKAGALLASDVSLSAGHWLIRPATFIGSVIYALLFGLAMNFIMSAIPKV